jgi:hypothetical protein
MLGTIPSAEQVLSTAEVRGERHDTRTWGATQGRPLGASRRRRRGPKARGRGAGRRSRGRYRRRGRARRGRRRWSARRRRVPEGAESGRARRSGRRRARPATASRGTRSAARGGPSGMGPSREPPTPRARVRSSTPCGAASPWHGMRLNWVWAGRSAEFARRRRRGSG